MESILQNVARSLAGFEFTFEDYRVDEGESIVEHATIHFENEARPWLKNNVLMHRTSLQEEA